MTYCRVIRAESVETIAHIPVIVIGGGGTGLTAALAVRDGSAGPVEQFDIVRDLVGNGTLRISRILVGEGHQFADGAL